MRYKIIEKALKLKELSLRGVEGEKENAKRMLDLYIEKHNITEEELQSNDIIKWDANMTLDQLIKECEIELSAFGAGLFSFAMGTFFKNGAMMDTGLNNMKMSMKKRKK